LITAAAAVATAAAARPELQFSIDHGTELNRFVREGPVAAHLQLRSGEHPRLLVAFPAGNSGVALWFTPPAKPIAWQIESQPKPLTTVDGQGRPLRGLEFVVSVDIPALAIEGALLGSIRTIRDFETAHTIPQGVFVAPEKSGNRLEWARDRLDGAAGYRLSIELMGGGAIRGNQINGADRPIRLLIRALTGELPLTPVPTSTLLKASTKGTALTRNVLTFLSYREKFLAGSWRFDTYFGRDTLMTLALIGPVLKPAGLEDGFASVLSRTSASGEVAHEESIGEYPLVQGTASSNPPVYDYSMIDESFMLAPVIGPWLRANRRTAAEFLARPASDGPGMGDRLVRNLLWVVNRTARFAREPTITHLVGLKSGTTAGDWRDSPDGLGGGRYPYDVNAVLVPAALRSITAMVASGMLDPYLSESNRHSLEAANTQLAVWLSKAPAAFSISKPAGEARTAVSTYAARLGIDPAPALRSMPSTGTMAFDALALDEAGHPIPVMHSDGGFELLFDDPPANRVEQWAANLTRPFPAGLLLPVGMLVANPVFADEQTQEHFNNTAYHGTVIWSWQQALAAAGLQRQLAREDLPERTRTLLRAAQARLWSAIRRSASLQSSELWSWSYTAGTYCTQPYAQGGDESNAAQLWSTAFLALSAVGDSTRTRRETPTKYGTPGALFACSE
jgi:hypothetical protein